MKLNLKYTYPELERVTLESGSRYYVCPETGKQLPSVTTILSATSSKDFSGWEARVGKARAKQERDYGANLGSLVHDHMEKYILNEERPKGNNYIRVEAKKMADAMIEKALPPITELWGVETILYYPELYAGTTDLVGMYNGLPSIMDFKTAKKIRKRDEIEDYRDQLGAYSLAHNAKYGTSLQQGVVLMIARDLSYEKFVYNATELKEGESSFLNRVATFYETFKGFY